LELGTLDLVYANRLPEFQVSNATWNSWGLIGSAFLETPKERRNVNQFNAIGTT
jgi:hypothetical protein